VQAKVEPTIMAAEINGNNSVSIRVESDDIAFVGA
jgi:hypothetical protein